MPWCLKLAGPIVSAFLASLALIGCTATDGPAATSGNASRCRLGFVGDMPMLNAKGSPLVRIKVDGTPAIFVIDSGAQINSVDPAYQTILGLTSYRDETTEHNQLPMARMSGVDGETFGLPVVASTVNLGHANARDVVFFQGVHLGNELGHQPVAGLLGAEMLANYDAIIDFPDRWIGLLRVTNCPAPRPLWLGPYQTVPFQRNHPTHGAIGLTLTLDQTTVHGILDTGAEHSIIEFQDAMAAGVTRAQLATDPRHTVRGVAGQPVMVWRHRFTRLAIGPIVLDHPEIDVGTGTFTPLIGMDFLQTRRIWIPRDANVMYVENARDIPADDPLGPDRH